MGVGIFSLRLKVWEFDSKLDCLRRNPKKKILIVQKKKSFTYFNG